MESHCAGGPGPFALTYRALFICAHRAVMMLKTKAVLHQVPLYVDLLLSISLGERSCSIE